MARQPKYEEIAADLERQIDSGVLAAGAKLPTEAELKAKYDASRNTVREALRRLMDRGRVDTRAGQGTYVTQKVEVEPFVTVLSVVTSPEPADGSGKTDTKVTLGGSENAAYLSEVGKEHRSPELGELQVSVLIPPQVIGSRLRCQPGDQVVSRLQIRKMDKQNWSLQNSYYPLSFVTGGATRLLMVDDIEEGTVQYLKDTLGIDQVGYRDWITARNPDKNEQDLFNLRWDDTVFVLYRTAFDQEQRPLRVTVTVFPADRNQFIIDVGQVPPPEYKTD
jgi:GntR family transcriptional regulator